MNYSDEYKDYFENLNINDVLKQLKKLGIKYKKVKNPCEAGFVSTLDKENSSKIKLPECQIGQQLSLENRDFKSLALKHNQFGAIVLESLELAA